MHVALSVHLHGSFHVCVSADEFPGFFGVQCAAAQDVCCVVVVEGAGGGQKPEMVLKEIVLSFCRIKFV